MSCRWPVNIWYAYETYMKVRINWKSKMCYCKNLNDYILYFHNLKCLLDWKVHVQLRLTVVVCRGWGRGGLCLFVVGGFLCVFFFGGILLRNIVDNQCSHSVMLLNGRINSRQSVTTIYSIHNLLFYPGNSIV